MVHGKLADLPNIRSRRVLVEKPKVDDMEEQRLRKRVSGECQLRPFRKMGVQVRGMDHRKQVVKGRSGGHSDPRQGEEIRPETSSGTSVGSARKSEEQSIEDR